MEATTDSVFQLVTHLCQAMCNDYNKQRVHGPPLGERAVKKYRNNAFEILLHRNSEDAGSTEDSLREFQFHQFDMRQKARTTLDRDRCDQLEKCIEKLLTENRFFRSDPGQSVLMLLLLLKNTTPFDVESSVMEFYPFGFFSSLRSCTETNPYICISEDMCRIPKRLAVDVENQYRQLNPYMPNPLIFIQPTDPKYQKLDYFFKLNFEVNPRHPSWKAKEILPDSAATAEEEVKLVKQKKEDDAPIGPLALSWLHLGQPASVSKERPFVTETPSATFHLINLVERQSGGEYSLKVVPEHFYLMNLKYLCTGVESDCFKYDPVEVSFCPQETGLTVCHFAAETVVEMNRQFIEFGTCFKRLELATSVIPETRTMPVEGFVYKSLSKAVNQFLFSIRHFIFNGPRDETMMQFSMRIRKFSGIVVFFAKLFQIHPGDHRVVDMPKGSRLLVYLYEILMDEMNKQDKVIPVVTIIRDCCQAYYQLFQQWIFNGILTDPHSELFINYTDQYKLQTKYYFDKSFYLRTGDVPAFLKGYEQDLLLCGKYTMLLREYKPNHKIFSLSRPPKVHVCLSYEAIQHVKDVCSEYLKNGYRSCGGRLSVREIFAEMREKKSRLKKSVSTRFQENLVKWQEEIVREKSALLAEKMKRREELLLQIEERKMNTLERRRAEIELEKECEEYDHKLEEIELLRVAEERRKRIGYYEELHQIANAKKSGVDAVVGELEQELRALKGDNDATRTCNENYRRQLEENLDVLNANAAAFTQNKTRVMGSQLSGLLDENLVVDVPKATTSAAASLTEGQRNKIKVLSEEFDFKNYENCDNKEQAIVEMGKKILTEAQRNKRKVLAHEFNNNSIESDAAVDEDQVVLIEKGAVVLTERAQNKKAAMGHQFMEGGDGGHTRDEEGLPTRILSEMERNRLKVMSHEFAIDVPMEEKLASAIKEETMTELQKNRRKILFGNVTGGSEVHLDLGLNQMTDRQRNKRKFFESELGQQLGVICAPATVPSPMSMTSDPPDEGDVLPEVAKEDHEVIDEEEEESQVEVQESPAPKVQTFMEFLKPILGLHSSNVFEVSAAQSSDGDGLEGEDTEREGTPPKVEFKRSDLKKLSSFNFETVNQLLQQSLTIPLKTQLELMNNEILKMYLIDLDIYSHFKSLRNYFFLMDGEFGIHICEGLISALESGVRPSRLYSFGTLNTTLEQAFGASVSGKDKNGARLSFALVKNMSSSEFNLLSPNVLEDLELMYQLEWPLNLILCPQAIHQYSTIFQYLLKVRRIGWVLENSSYMSLKISAKTLSRDLLTSPQYRHVQLIRHKFSQFVNCLKNHITSSAIQSSWKRFKDDLLTVKSMADLHRHHSAYIKQIRFLCMLNRTSQEFQTRINDIFTIILRFNNHLNSAAEPRWHIKEGKKEEDGEAVNVAVRSKKKVPRSIFSHPNYEKMCKDEQDFDKCCNYVMYLGGKIVRRGYQVELNEFLNLVNVNGFYKGVQKQQQQSSSASSVGVKK